MAQKVTSDEETYLRAAASNGHGTDTSGDYFETSESEFENIINCQPVKRNEALAAYARQRILSNSTELNKNLSFMTSSSDDEGDTDSFDEQNNISVLPMNFDESLTPHFNDSERTNPADKTPKQVPAAHQTSDREQKSIKSIKNTVRAKHNILKSLEESKTILVRQFNVVASDAKETEDEQLTLLERKGRQVTISAITSDIDYCDLEETDVPVVALQQQSGGSMTASAESECETNSCYQVKTSASTRSGTVSPNVIERKRYENAQQIEDDKSEMNRKSREKLMQFKLNLLKWKESQNFSNSRSSQEEETVEENIKEDASDAEYDDNDDKEGYIAESCDEEVEYETESLTLSENEADLSEYGSYSTDSTSAEYTTSATDDNSTEYTDAVVTDDSSPCTSYAKNDMIRERMHNIIRSAKPSESEQLIKLEEANKSQTDLLGKNLSKARIPVPARFPAVRPFRNRSFTDLQMREIARENNILARKLVALKPKKYNNAYQQMVPRKIIAPSLTTRKKQQQQIDFENNILKGKLMAIGRRKPLF
ncbi:uncharacterized protein LOC119685417 [Teleopsis dalmanni]|uniref:uncharacterized protein LOC119685417 n=1 Tax=Teleopsis dalmanni TaxID=139649 RepID=UPI0018CD3AE1|nr:uncharacterized protein LOC119685417 [Teleopsis dalmanni]